MEQILQETRKNVCVYSVEFESEVEQHSDDDDLWMVLFLCCNNNNEIM